MPCLSRGVLKIQPNQCIMHLLLFVRSLFFLNFYYVFVLPRFEFPGTTNRPRVNRKYGIGFSCCYLLEALLSCLTFHKNCYLAPILPTMLQLVIRKAELQPEWRNLSVFEAFERNRRRNEYWKLFIVIILRTALFYIRAILFLRSLCNENCSV